MLCSSSFALQEISLPLFQVVGVRPHPQVAGGNFIGQVKACDGRGPRKSGSPG